MGSTQAEGYAQAAACGMASMRQAVSAHLTSNMYPPVGFMIDAAIAAIEAVAREDYGEEITLPEGVTFKGAATAPAHGIVEGLRLEAFLIDYDEEDE